MSKQDGYASRTAADLERKYNFGQTFAEVYGLVADARKAAEEAQNAFDGLDQEAIFNLLTNNGQAQGIYRDDGGNVYVNASFVKIGSDSLTDVVATTDDIEGLKAEFKVSEDGVSSIIASYKKDLEGYQQSVSEYEQTVGEFRDAVNDYSSAVDEYASEVTAYTEQMSSFQQTVNGFSTKVQSYETTVRGYEGALENYESAVDGYADEVAGYAGEVNGYAGAVNGYAGEVAAYTRQVSSFEQTAEKISLTVAGVSAEDGKVTAASIVAAINETSGDSIVQIAADHIVMTGTVTFAKASDIPKKVSQLSNDSGFVNTTGAYALFEDAIFANNIPDKDTVTTITESSIKSATISGNQIIGGEIKGCTLNTNVDGAGVEINDEEIQFTLFNTSLYSINAASDVSGFAVDARTSSLILSGDGGIFLFPEGTDGPYWELKGSGFHKYTQNGQLLAKIEAVYV